MVRIGPRVKLIADQAKLLRKVSAIFKGAYLFDHRL